MTFSAGMPLLYAAAALSFELQYWTDKYELLKMCQQPVRGAALVGIYRLMRSVHCPAGVRG